MLIWPVKWKEIKDGVSGGVYGLKYTAVLINLPSREPDVFRLHNEEWPVMKALLMKLAAWPAGLTAAMGSHTPGGPRHQLLGPSTTASLVSIPAAVFLSILCHGTSSCPPDDHARDQWAVLIQSETAPKVQFTPCFCTSLQSVCVWGGGGGVRIPTFTGM